MAEVDILEILLKLKQERKRRVSDALIKACYEIEKQYQYDERRERPVRLIEKLVDDEVQKELDSTK